MRLRLVAALLLGLPSAVQGQEPATWRLAETLRIGAVDGPSALSRVSSLAVSDDGSMLYVAQPQEHTIRVFDATTGAALASFGKGGEGPGEFRDLLRLGWRGDSLYATDFFLQRISLFSSTGEHFATEVVNPPLQMSNPRASHPLGVTAAGTVVSGERLSVLALAEGSVTSSPWSLVGRDGVVLGQVGVRDLREVRTAVPAGGRVTLMHQPFSTRNYLALHPQGTSMVVLNQPAGRDRPGTYEVSRFHPDGTPIYARTYRYTPVPVPEEIADSIISFETMVLEQWLPRGRAEEAAREHLIIPESFPPISNVVLGRDDSVWLRKEDSGETTVRWFVLDAAGRLQAALRAPASLDIRLVEADVVWGVVQDELGIPYVVRCAILR